MPNESVFPVSPDEWAVINQQRVITAQINRDVVKVGAVYLRQSSKIPANDNWATIKYLDTNLADWVDSENHRFANVGFNLQQGWVDIDVDSEDSEYNRCIHQALQHVGVDCRLAFGRLSAGVPKHFLVQLSEEEAKNFDEFKKFQPQPVIIKGKRLATELRSTPVGAKEPDAKQTVVPGSLYGDRSRYDISVWWNGRGNIARSLSEITSSSTRICPASHIIRAIAIGTILYAIKPHWVSGTRQITSLKFNGWLARLVGESHDINNSEQLAAHVYCPIDEDLIAESILNLVCTTTRDDESRMRIRNYYEARGKLERNPDAKIPGWPALKELLGEELVLAIRAVCLPGADVSILMKLIERYIYEETTGRYIDRERFKSAQQHFIHAADDLYRRHKPDTIMLKKPMEAFKSFEMSKMRKSVGVADLYPLKPPGEIFRFSRSKGPVADEFEGDDSHLVFNIWRGWDHKPTNSLSRELLCECELKLDRVLAWLTCDRKEQIGWIKSWIAWTLQFPGDKQQIAWVVVGGQGVGKSFVGNVFCNAIFGSLHGMVSGKIIGERFSVSPFIGKMFVFADEVRFKGQQSIDEIKLLIRNIRTHGEQKGIDARDYNIFARLMFASNNADIHIGQANMLDRALFYTKAYTPEFMGISQIQFNEWTLQHKPFFDEFGQFLQRSDVREHYMHLFMNMKVNRHAIEDIKWSSSREADIMLHNISGPRKIAKVIIEEGRVFEGLDISTPFSQYEFTREVTELCKKMNENIRAAYVFEEFNKLGMLEQVTVNRVHKFRFKWMIGDLTTKFGDAIGIMLEPRFEFGPGDYGPNTNDGVKPIMWRGQKRDRF